MCGNRRGEVNIGGEEGIGEQISGTIGEGLELPAPCY